MNESLKKIKKNIQQEQHKKEINAVVVKVEEKLELIKVHREEKALETVEQIKEVIEYVKSLLERRDQGFRDLTAYLDYHKDLIDKRQNESAGMYVDIVDAINTLVKTLEKPHKVSINNPESIKTKRAEAVSVVKEALDTIEKLLVSQNVEPDSTDYEWTKEKMTQVREHYDGYDLITTLTYDRYGHLVSTTITKE